MGDFFQFIKQCLLRDGFFGENVGYFYKELGIAGHSAPVELFDIGTGVTLFAGKGGGGFCVLPVGCRFFAVRAKWSARLYPADN